METAISVSEVTKTYESGAAAVQALDRVNFEAQIGEVVFLMGPSGSGKTTLLSIMGCILRPTSGRVKIHGREIDSFSERQLPCGRDKRSPSSKTRITGRASLPPKPS